MYYTYSYISYIYCIIQARCLITLITRIRRLSEAGTKGKNYDPLYMLVYVLMCDLSIIYYDTLYYATLYITYILYTTLYSKMHMHTSLY